jgi:meso-butanediol dehydrogenase/(S,S)-butanediol dehydrogenase/diacetyl reductase
MSNILVTGSESGLGYEISSLLHDQGHNVWGYDIKFGKDVLNPNLEYDEPIENLDILINCAGVNGIDMLEDVKDDLWERVIGTNAKGIMKMSQACLPLLIKSKGTILNIVSNAAHMPMTSSICYNASKGAALIMTKQMARELTKRWGITVFSVSPNKLRDTEMSRQIDSEVVRTRGWSLEEAQRYQLAGLLTGEETEPKAVAEFIAFLLQDKEHHKYLSGCDLPYGL